MRSFLSVVAIFFIGCSASTPSENTTKKKISVLEPAFASYYTIYFLGDENISLNEITRLPMQGFKLIEMLPDSISFDGYHAKSIGKGDDGFINDITLLINTFIDLSEEETTALGNAEHAISMIFFGTSANIIQKQKDINDFIYTLVKDKHVIVVDASTFQFYNPALWKEHRVDNFNGEFKNVTGQVTIHTYRENEFCRAVTLGMNKFCLPEISIKDFSCYNQNTIGALINATIQTLFENPHIYDDSTLMIDLTRIRNDTVRNYMLDGVEENVKKAVELKLKSVAPEEGDNPTTQLLIVFDNDEYGSPQRQQENLLQTLFGSTDSILSTEHDEELLKASENARGRLPELKQSFNEGLEPGYTILVKVPFETEDGSNEWMWVEVIKWTDNEMEGILQNDPYEVSYVKAGALVKINEPDIFDYILSKPDGSYEGNVTGEVLESRD